MAPLLGCVMKTCTVPPPVGGGGGAVVFETLTVALAVAVAPAESRTVPLTACEPLAARVVSQATVFDVLPDANVLPPAVMVYV